MDQDVFTREFAFLSNIQAFRCVMIFIDFETLIKRPYTDTLSSHYNSCNCSQ